MKRLLLFLILLFSIPVLAQTQPALEMLIFPKYIESGSNGTFRNGIPYVYRARITGLKPNTTYRYENKIVNTVAASIGAPYYLFILPPGNVPTGTLNYTEGSFYKSPVGTSGLKNGSTASSTLTNNYGVLTADAAGSYTGWFIQETVSSRTEGLTVFVRISLNKPLEVDPASNVNSIAYSLTSPADQPITVLSMSNVDNAPGVPAYSTAIRSTPAASGIPKNFVFLYDNVTGNDADRPIAGTYIEDEGVLGVIASPNGSGEKNGLAPFYGNSVDGVNGAWGTMILNSDANGIRRIEQRSLADGSIVGYNTSADGTWADGANEGGRVSTALTKLGAYPASVNIVLDGSKVTLAAVKPPQTLTFTNTFPATFKVGDPDFTLSASSDKGLTDFQYSVAPAGILQVTGNTVKIVGGGTAVVTVTEPGNATIAAGTATQSITVDAIAQTITGLPGTFNAVYGDPNIALAATGGNSGNAIVYTSDDSSIAEITGSNQVVLKKSGTVIIRANQPGNTNYADAREVTGTLTITKAILDVIAENKIKVRGDINPEPTFIYGTFKNGDDAGSVSGTPVLSMNAETTSPAGEYDINIDVSGLTSDKYSFNPVKGKLSVENKVAQVITFSDFPATATYGTKPIVFHVGSNSTNAITFSSSNPNVARAEKNALGEWTVKITGAGAASLIASQAGDVNYIPGSATVDISVAKAPLTVIAEDKAKLTGAADPAFTVRYEGFVNGDGPDKLSGTLQFTKQADGADYLIIPSGLTATNYTLTFANGKLTEASTAFAPMYKVYGDAAFDPGAASTSGNPVYTVANTAIAVVNTAGLIEIKGAGSTAITATFTGGSNATATLQVDKKAVTITPDAKTKAYAQANPILTTGYTGLVYGERESVFTVQPQLSTTAELNSATGNYAIKAAGAVANNYLFSYEQGVLTVTKAELAFTYNDLPAVTYGDASFIPATTTNFAAQPVFSSDNAGVATIENGSVKINGAGTANIRVSFAGTENYTAGTAVKTLTVAKRALTVHVDNKTKLYGQNNPVLTGTYTGFVNNETITAVSAPAVFTTLATPLSHAGTYVISATAAAAQNYTFDYEPGTLTVEKAVLTVTADNKTRNYGLDNPAFTFKYAGFVNEEDASVLENPAIATTDAIATSSVGIYPIVPLGASDENYTFNYLNGLLSITSTGRTITLDPLPVTFIGDADFTPLARLSSGETPIFTSADPTIATIVDNKIHVVSPGSVVITATAPVNTNYSAKPAFSQYLLVRKAEQTITFENIPVLTNDGKTYTLKATSTSGLPVSFTVSDPSYLSINEGTIKALRIGKVKIMANQAGDSRYNAAVEVVNDVIVVDASGDKIKVHPALSINGDGKNEFLSIDGIKDFPINTVTIIDRSGLKVAVIKGYDNDLKVFTGKSKVGTALPQGTYFCLIEYNVDAQVKSKTGYFILKY